MLYALFPAGGVEAAAVAPAVSWTLFAVLLASGFAIMISMVRTGIRVFWVPLESEVPSVRFLEMVPIVVLLSLCAAMTVAAGPVQSFMQATAQSLHAPQGYIGDVLSAPRVQPAPSGVVP
jgi:multicomponent K+:H+ antiporter subunit D